MTKRLEIPSLLFFTTLRSGPARRMESLLAQVERKHRRRLRVITVDADASGALTEAFEVGEIPTLVLLRDRRPVARLKGRASGSEIDAMLRRHLPATPAAQAA